MMLVRWRKGGEATVEILWREEQMMPWRLLAVRLEESGL